MGLGGDKIFNFMAMLMDLPPESSRGSNVIEPMSNGEAHDACIQGVN